MKKLLFSVSLLAGLAAFAAADEIDASAQTFGVLPITTGEANVIVAVPWVVATNVNDVDTIPVADIIKTANLTEGDWVRVWNTDRKLFNVWTLTDVEGILTWVPGDTVSEAGIAAGEGADITSLKRGDALILHRQNPKDENGDPKTFYVYGRYKSTLAAATVCAQGTSDAPAYTLIAPPSTTDVDVNDGITWTGVKDSADQLVFPDGTMPTYKTNDEVGTWGAKVVENKKWVWKKLVKDIPAGTGIWYISRGGQATATWK